MRIPSDAAMDSACVAYMATLRAGKLGGMQEAAVRLFGPSEERGGQWSWSTPEFQACFKAFQRLKADGRATYLSHQGWRLT